MIVPMKKATVITTVSDRVGALERLRELGVLHVAPVRPVENAGLTLREIRNELQRVVNAFPDDAEQTAWSGGGDAAVDEARRRAEDIAALQEQRQRLTDEADRIGRDLERLAPWGDIDPQALVQLRAAGVTLVLAELAASDRAALDEIPYVVVERTKTQLRIVLHHDGGALPEQVTTVAVPDRSPKELRARLDEIALTVGALEGNLDHHAKARPLFERAIAHLDEEIAFAEARDGMGTTHDLAWIEGFVPEGVVASLRETAQRDGWGLVVREPAPEDPVPTQTKNPAAVRLIQPVFDLLGTVPGYREFDISFWFLAFFTLFFAMIIGDGGYGAVLLVGSAWVAIRTRAAGRPLGDGHRLMILLSVATVAWGAVTGNWFGYAEFADLPILRSLVIDSLATTNPASGDTLQFLCFVLGTVHLSIAHVWGFIRQLQSKPRITALAQLGWWSVVLGLYFLVLQLVLDPVRYPMPDFALWMIIGGLAAVLLFGAQEAGSGFIAGVGRGFSGIITTVLDGVSAFSDIISYIRLFAVGLASLAIAEAFNEMALGIGEGVGAAIAAAVILALGHTLNLAMGALSVVVHGVRLNMLEFSGHLGMEWTGVSYAPFRKADMVGEV